MNNGIIYGFIGPKGGGKTHQLNRYKQQAEQEQQAFLLADFSDGIREAVADFLGEPKANIDPASNSYAIWKSQTFQVRIPDGEKLKDIFISGRSLLIRVGEGMKSIAGDDVWVKWSCDDILKKYYALSDEKRKEACLGFGSVRFVEEAEALFTLSKLLNKKVKLIFCNFHNEKFDENVHRSEKLAHLLIKEGFKDGADITEFYQEKLKFVKI